MLVVTAWASRSARGIERDPVAWSHLEGREGADFLLENATTRFLRAAPLLCGSARGETRELNTLESDTPCPRLGKYYLWIAKELSKCDLADRGRLDVIMFLRSALGAAAEMGSEMGLPDAVFKHALDAMCYDVAFQAFQV